MGISPPPPPPPPPNIGSIYPTWTPTTGPSYPVQLQQTPKLLQNDFGDGYSQIVGDGLNYSREAYNLTWTNCPQDEHDEMYNFWATQKSFLPFWYQPPNNVMLLWRWQAWKEETKDPGFYTITVQLTPAFDLG